jgi:hypothetical protein
MDGPNEPHYRPDGALIERMQGIGLQLEIGMSVYLQLFQCRDQSGDSHFIEHSYLLNVDGHSLVIDPYLESHVSSPVRAGS